MNDLVSDSNIIGNVVGSFIAVSGAIFVLYLSEKLRKNGKKEEATNNFLKELEYLRDMIKKSKKSAEEMIERLSVGSTDLYFNHDSSNILSQASQTAYQEGLLYENLEPEQIAKFNSDVLSFFGNTNYPVETHVREQVKKWQEGELKNDELYQALYWVKEKADEAIKLLKSIENSFRKNTRKSKVKN